MSPKRWLVVAVALAVALATVSTGTVLAQASQHANLRIFHAVPGASPVDVFVDGNLTFGRVAYKQATDYAALPAGQHTLLVVPAGSGVQGQALLNTTLNLPADSYNTLAAVGRPGSVQPLALTNSSTLPPNNEARVRLVHAAPNAPAVDVALQGGPVLFSNVSFPSSTDYIVVSAGTVQLEIRPAGTTDVVRSVPQVTLNGATVYTLFAVGLLDGQPPLEAVTVVDAPPIQPCRQLVGVPAAATPSAPTARPTQTPRATATVPTATPVTGTPVTGTPVTGTPVTGTPVTGTPVTGTPVTGTPVTGTPVTSTPVTGTPVTSTPVTGTAVTETPQETASPQATATEQPITPSTPTGAPLVDAAGIGLFAAVRARCPASVALEVALSLAALLGGLALGRRLF